MNNLMQAAQDIKYLPDDQLNQMIQNPSPSVPGFLVLSELDSRNKTREAAQAQATAQQQPQTTIAQEVGMKNRQLAGSMGQMMGYAAGGPVDMDDTSEQNYGLPSLADGLGVASAMVDGGQQSVAPDGWNHNYSYDQFKDYQSLKGGNMFSMAKARKENPEAYDNYRLVDRMRNVVGAKGGDKTSTAKGGMDGSGLFGFFGDNGTRPSDGTQVDKPADVANPQSGFFSALFGNRDKKNDLNGDGVGFADGGPVGRFDMSSRGFAEGGAVDGLMPLTRGPDGRVRFGR